MRKNFNRQSTGGNKDSSVAIFLFDAFFGAALGQAFSGALNMPAWTNGVDWNNAIDAADEFWMERRKARKPRQAAEENTSPAYAPCLPAFRL